MSLLAVPECLVENLADYAVFLTLVITCNVDFYDYY